MTVQTQTQDVFNLAWKYIDTLRKELTSRLEELLRKHGVKLHDLFVTYKTENDIVKFKVEVEVDVSGKVANVIPCLYWEGVYENCSETVCQDEECEEELEKMIEECVSNIVEEYRNEYGGLPFEFRYERKGIVEAHLEVREIEDSVKLCIRDILAATFYVQIGAHYLKEIIDDPEAIQKVVDYDIEQIIGELDSILEAVKTLV